MVEVTEEIRTAAQLAAIHHAPAAWVKTAKGAAAFQQAIDAALEAALSQAEPETGAVACHETPSGNTQAGLSVTDEPQPSPSQSGALAHGEAVGWPEPKITNPDIANPTGVPYLDCLLHRLLDAQQDINLEANERMSQSLCDASALLDEIETAIRRFTHPSPQPSGPVVAWKVHPDQTSPMTVGPEEYLDAIEDENLTAIVDALELAVEWLEIDQAAEERGVVDRIRDALKLALSAFTSGTPSPAQEGPVVAFGLAEAAKIIKARLPLYKGNLAQENAVKECLSCIRSAITSPAQGPMDGEKVRGEDWENAAHELLWEAGQEELFDRLAERARQEASDRLASAPQPSTRSTSTAGGDDAQ